MYPGMYVPRPLEMTVARSESTKQVLATEMLALYKLNWNNTQFDGGEPITVRAVRQVGGVVGVHRRAKCSEPRRAALSVGAGAPRDHRDERCLAPLAGTKERCERDLCALALPQRDGVRLVVGRHLDLDEPPPLGQVGLRRVPGHGPASPSARQSRAGTSSAQSVRSPPVRSHSLRAPGRRRSSRSTSCSISRGRRRPATRVQRLVEALASTDTPGRC